MAISKNPAELNIAKQSPSKTLLSFAFSFTISLYLEYILENLYRLACAVKRLPFPISVNIFLLILVITLP